MLDRGELGLKPVGAVLLDKAGGISGVCLGPDHIAVTAKAGLRPKGEREQAASCEVESPPDLQGQETIVSALSFDVALDYAGASAERAFIGSVHEASVRLRGGRCNE